MELNSDLFVELAIFVLACAFVLVFVIDAMKTLGWIAPGKAGHWNQGLSTVTGFLVFYLTYTGNQGRIADAREGAVMIAGAVVYIMVQVFASKLWHDLLEWIQGKATFPIQLPFTTPVKKLPDAPKEVAHTR